MNSLHLQDLATMLAPRDLEAAPVTVICTGERPELVELHPCVAGVYLPDAQAVDPSLPFGLSAIVLNTRLVRRTDDQIATLLHELGHAVEIAFQVIPLTMSVAEVAAETRVELKTFTCNAREPLTPPWVADRHTLRWLRATLHLCHRAQAVGYTIDVEAVASLLPAFSPAAAYLAALGPEPALCRNDSLQDILSRPAPDAFQALWNADVQPWFDSHAHDINEGGGVHAAA